MEAVQEGREAFRHAFIIDSDMEQIRTSVTAANTRHLLLFMIHLAYNIIIHILSGSQLV